MSYIESATKFTTTLFGWINAIVFIVIGYWVATNFNQIFVFTDPTHILVLLLLTGYVSFFISITVAIRFIINRTTESTNHTKKVSKKLEKLEKTINQMPKDMKKYMDDINSQLKTFYDIIKKKLSP